MNIVLITSRIDAGIRFFLYVLIFWLPYSPAVIEVSVVAGLFLWILKHCFIFFHQLKQEKDLKCFYPPSSILNKPISFFIIICIISIMSSAFFEQALHGFISKTLEWFIIYFLIIETFKDKKCVYIAVGIFLFTAVSTVLDGLIQCYWTHKDIFSGHILDPDGRVNASFRTPNGLGGYLTIVVGILLGSFFTMKNGFWRIGFGILIGLTLWVEFLTYSRGSWIGIILGIMLFFGCFLVIEKQWPKSYVYLLVVTTILIFVLFSVVMINGEDTLGLARRTAQWRLGIWQESLPMVKDRPLLGHGLNTYMPLFQFYRNNFHYNPTYAHNSFLQLACEVGLLGLAAYLSIILKLFYKTIIGVKEGMVRDPILGLILLGLLSGVFSYFVQSFFDTNFYSLQLSVYVWYIMGLIAAGLSWQYQQIKPNDN